MILTGRAGLVALICIVPIALSPWPARAFLVLLVVLAAVVAVDIGLAASPRRLRYTRSPDTSARLGQQVDAGLLIHNDGRRRFRGEIRDAWPPSARAQPRTHPIKLAAGQHQHVGT
ncbi:MAG: DUF58 domain-containing protein, partial [Mycobacterium sp.]